MLRLVYKNSSATPRLYCEYMPMVVVGGGGGGGRPEILYQLAVSLFSVSSASLFTLVLSKTIVITVSVRIKSLRVVF